MSDLIIGCIVALVIITIARTTMKDEDYYDEDNDV